MSTENNSPPWTAGAQAPAVQEGNGAPAAPPAPATTVVPPAANAAPPAPPAPAVVLPPPAAPAKGDPEAIAKATEALKDAQDDLGEMDKWLDSANKERKARVARLEAAQAKLDALQPVQTNSDAIQAYLAQQRANLAIRGEQIAKANAFQKEHGFKLLDLLPKRSPLDSAMARKNSRGAGRPGGAK